VILAALHDLALAGRAPALAAAYAAADGDAADGTAIDTLLRITSVVAVAVRRKTRTNETGRCAVVYPAIAEAARRAGANAVGLIDVGTSAGFNLNVDHVGITYSNRQSLGDPSSPVQLSASIVGDCACVGSPAIPTLGDRRASGHSIIGLAVFDQSALHTEAIGRCWSRGPLAGVADGLLTGH
jgi:hypothetical protein